MNSIKAITDFIRDQMDGAPMPPANSPALQNLSSAIGDIQKHDSNQELIALALQTIGLVIDRASSSITAEKTLHRFIRGDRD